MVLSEKLLEILACPACKCPLEYDRQKEKLICHECGRRFKIEDDIPNMLLDEAEGGPEEKDK